jgi:hypothetical protein
MPTMTVTEQVATINRYQRDCWMMHYADEALGAGSGIDLGDPSDRNYWMILPAERVAVAWQYEQTDASCTTCHRPLEEHGWGDGLDACTDEPEVTA